jgi:hypothetical protein
MHNAKTSATNTVSHFTTNDKYQMASEQHHEKSAALRVPVDTSLPHHLKLHYTSHLSQVHMFSTATSVANMDLT